MQLQRQESRKIKGKKYDKWVITIPPSIVNKLEWKEGEELKAQMLKRGILLFSATIENDGDILTYKTTAPRVEKYTPHERFLKIYNNLPLSERIEVVVVINDEAITWQIARNNIIHGTPLGNEILKKLVELEII
ncbi:MAG: hypothetical protein KAS04_05780 [Candidatus Aenigmarchaeota archaeon]|nr:hypothetical protein [Candidatus Aenigmarchaeota archaeon]